MERLRPLVVLGEEEEEPAVAGAAAASGPASTLRTQPQATRGAASLALHSPLLPPLSPPPADAEVVELERQADARAQHIAELRSSMLPQLQQLLAARLAAFRPTAELEPEEEEQQQQQTDAGAAGDAAAQQQGAPAAHDAAEQRGEGAHPQQDAPPAAGGEAEQQTQPMQADGEAPQPAAAPLPLSPQPAELQARLAAAANRMPALRARLEAATDRLQRVVSAVSADINRPPPNTVEKALAGKTPGRPGAGGGEGEENVPGVSPLVKQVGGRPVVGLHGWWVRS